MEKNLLSRTSNYLKKNGFRRTVAKIYMKLVEDDAKEYAAYLNNHKLTDVELAEQRAISFVYEPLVSIVIPIYNTPLDFLKELIDSIESQTYSNWELCLADGSETDNLKFYVEKYSNNDSRVKYRFLGFNDGISNNTNGAIEIATGDYIAFSDHDDLLRQDALFEVVKAINTKDNVDCVYTDEDKIDMDGKTLFKPHFKPDYNIDLLCSNNYVTHFFVIKKQLLDEIGWLNKEYDGSQDYDLIIRAFEKARLIEHVAKPVYHWRCHRNSTAMNPESKMYCYTAGQKAVQAHWDRLGIPATVDMDAVYGHYVTRYNWKETPLVSVIIPNTNHKSDLETCINSILDNSTYANIEIVVVENNSTDDDIFEYYKEIEGSSSVKIVKYDAEFNYSKINNYGVSYASGDYILFLNNDTKLIAQDSIKSMLDICMREDVGAVGARLYYADDTIQHAGVVIGADGVMHHAFRNMYKAEYGYFMRSKSVMDVSAVTAACMMIARSDFESVGGFCEKLAVAYNDVDLCFKLRKKGKWIVFDPYSEWYHYESKSRGYDVMSEDKQRRLKAEEAILLDRWHDLIGAGDPYYNVNFTNKNANYEYDA